MDTKELGELGEKISCEYLVEKGYKILGRNYRISFGEVDIIVKKKWHLKDLFSKNSLKRFAILKQPIHFVEVKTIIANNNGFYSGFAEGFFPEQKVDYKKQKKLIQLSQIWLEKNKLPQDYPYQIDVIGILVDQKSRNAKLHYFQNVIEDT